MAHIIAGVMPTPQNVKDCDSFVLLIMRSRSLGQPPLEQLKDVELTTPMQALKLRGRQLQNQGTDTERKP
jgi:hypothetical protein